MWIILVKLNKVYLKAGGCIREAFPTNPSFHQGEVQISGSLRSLQESVPNSEAWKTLPAEDPAKEKAASGFSSGTFTLWLKLTAGLFHAIAHPLGCMHIFNYPLAPASTSSPSPPATTLRKQSLQALVSQT